MSEPPTAPLSASRPHGRCPPIAPPLHQCQQADLIPVSSHCPPPPLHQCQQADLIPVSSHCPPTAPLSKQTSSQCPPIAPPPPLHHCQQADLIPVSSHCPPPPPLHHCQQADLIPLSSHCPPPPHCTTVSKQTSSLCPPIVHPLHHSASRPHPIVLPLSSYCTITIS